MPPKKQPSRRIKKEKITKKPKDLEEEIDTFLTTRNPYMSAKCAEYEYKTQTFKPVNDFKKAVLFYKAIGSIKRKLKGLYGVVYEDLDKKEEKVVRNNINFRTIATQTEAKHFTDQKDGIDPSLSPSMKFGDTASRVQIATAYKECEEKNKKEETVIWRGDIIALFKGAGRRNITLQDSYSLRLFERMLDQNMSGSNLDFMYYECPKDEFKPNFGSLLPLWNLSNRETKRMLVSSLCWNNHYPDLFAVGFRDNGEQLVDEMEERGLVYVYSLKGPSFPERIVRCASGVCSVLFHTSLPQIVIVALTSGDLELYDLSKTPIAVRESKFGTHFHEDTLCEVQWLPDKLPQKLCSISKDGTIINWLIFMNNLIPDEVVANLSIKEWPLREPPKGLEMAVKPKHPLRDALPVNSIGMSVSVNQQSASLFLASTVSGLIQEYTFEDKTCKTVFDEHSSSVRSVRWNPFHPDVFISCSNDFTVLVWEHTHKQPLFEFFFDRQLKDVSWAPFSSSLFAAISGNAVVSVFDLALNKVEAIGTYAVYTPKQNINLTKVLFHPTMPILIVGDEKGTVIILKLSPNIRSSLKDLNTEEFVSREREKMERLLKVSIRPAL